MRVKIDVEYGRDCAADNMTSAVIHNATAFETLQDQGGNNVLCSVSLSTVIISNNLI